MPIDPAKLINQALTAMGNAYAPYSKYRVGAALLIRDGEVITGCNVENASFGMTSCAERTAFCSAVASGRRDFDAIAIVSDGKDIPTPCGACRQVMSEFCKKDFIIYAAVSNNPDSYREYKLECLLPEAFIITKE